MDIYTQPVQEEKDILFARDRARVISEELGFAVTQQLQITTAVFELGKNILEHGKGGTITFSIQPDDDAISLEVIGRDDGPGLSDEQIAELLGASSGTTALRGVPAMKRMMDKIEIESEPDAGTTIRLLKRKPDTGHSLARNVASFFKKKFSARETPTISEELRVQNQNLVQTLSLIEGKNEELQQTNHELLSLKQELERSNDELHERSAELQEALLSLGDRTTELESHNRRFNALFKMMNEGVVITDRSGLVTQANPHACQWLGVGEAELAGLSKQQWLDTLGSRWIGDNTEWARRRGELEGKSVNQFEWPGCLKDSMGGALTLRTSPMLDQDGKMIGRLWFVRPCSQPSVASS